MKTIEKIFRGKTINELPHGKGFVSYDDGTQFQCDYADGLRNGTCIQQFSNGDSFSAYICVIGSAPKGFSGSSMNSI